MLEPRQGAGDADFSLPFFMGGQAGEWAEPGAGGWRARPCPAGWDPRGPAPGDGSDRAAAPTTTASGQGSHRLQAQRSCSVPALFSVPVGPACLLRARSAHAPWPLSAPRTPRPPTHYAGTGGLSRAMCLAQGCVSPSPPTPHTHTPQRPCMARCACSVDQGTGPGEGRPLGESALLGPGLRVRLPSLRCLHPPRPCISPMSCPHTLGTLTPWSSGPRRAVRLCPVQGLAGGQHSTSSRAGVPGRGRAGCLQSLGGPGWGPAP